MFPGVFEWIWDAGHVVFMGIFWLVIIVLGLGIFHVLRKTIVETVRESAEDGHYP